MNRQPVWYLQTDAKWKNLPYRTVGENSTIGGSGCGPTSAAMLIETLTGKKCTPVDTCKWSVDHGFKAKGQGTFYGYFEPQFAAFGLSCKMLNFTNTYGNSAHANHKTILDMIKKGYYVIACMGKGNWTSSGHFVVVWWVDEESDVVYINDPASTKATRLRGSYKLFKQQVKYYWYIDAREFNKNGNGTSSESVAKKVNYQVKVTSTDGSLNCRSTPSMAGTIVTQYKNGTVLTITKEQDSWGYTGQGWIALASTQKVTTNPKEDEDMDINSIIKQLTPEMCYAIMQEAYDYASKKEEPKWSKDEGHWERATEAGVVDGSAPERPMKRCEVMAVLGRRGLL